MARYGANNELGGTRQAMTTTYKTLLTLTAATATLTRAMIGEINVGADGTPADNVLAIDVSRVTAIGTGTSVTPPPIDSTFRAAGTVVTANHTVEPTYTVATDLLNWSVNQRAGVRWVANHGFELIVPAVNLSGIGIRAKSPAYTNLLTASALFEE